MSLSNGNKLLVLSMVLLTCLAVGQVQAQEGRHLDLTSTVEKEAVMVNDRGEEEVVVVPADTVLPGDTVILTTQYSNVGEDAAEKVVITNPVPDQLVYVGGSAQGDGTAITFSVDGGQTYDVPERLMVIGEDGRTRPAQPSEYTHIRWTLQSFIKPGDEGQVSFRASLK
jgi:uncharacterized repeat protein (TIGR01451 family)